MADQLERLQTALADRYAVEREIGAGGMATVYLAQDLRHHRSVAVKVLRPDLAATVGPERFLREIEISAQLNHPHILPVYDSGSAGGFLYYVMPYVEGESLRDRLAREKQLPMEEALEIAREVADALSSAHSRGIVHRDVKPENILLQEGHAAVADFGIARAVSMAAGEHMTESGMTIGTPAYMSPEQAAGESQLDGRSDLYSLGCVLYEMLGGDPPFSASTPQAMLARKLADPVPSLRVVRETVPEELESIVQRVLAKSPADRFATASQLVTALKSIPAAPTGSRPVAVARRRRGPWIAAGSIVLVVAAASALVILRPHPEGIGFRERDWIVIADLDNQTDEPVFDRSLNSAFGTAIAQSQFVNMVPRTQIEQTLRRMGRAEGERLNTELAREVALRDNHKAVVTFAVARLDTTYVLTSTVVDPSTGTAVRSQSVRGYGRGAVLPALDSLARLLRADLGESLDAIHERSVPLPQATTSSLEALKKFADGSVAWSDGRFVEARALWEEAIALDSLFAWAHAMLGAAYTWTNDRPQGDEEFRKASALLGRLTGRERLWVRSLIAGWQGNSEESIRLLRTYLQSYPDDRNAWFNLGRGLQAQSRPAEALEAYQHVLALNENDQAAYVNSGLMFDNLGDYDEAVASFGRAFELNPSDETRASGDLNRIYGFVYAKLGDTTRAREIFSKMLSGDNDQRANGLRSLALLDWYAGHYAAGIAHLREAIVLNRAADAKLSEFRNRAYLATGYAALGATTELEAELREGERLVAETYIGPEWLVYLGRQLARAGETRRAERVLQLIAERVNESNDYDRSAREMLRGELALQRGDSAAAREATQLAAVLMRSNVTRESLARVYVGLGASDLAAATFAEILEDQDLGWEAQQPWLEARYWLGRVHEAAARSSDAARSYQAFVELWATGDSDLVLLRDARERLARLR